jgi:hypothetical protein
VMKDLGFVNGEARLDTGERKRRYWVRGKFDKDMPRFAMPPRSVPPVQPGGATWVHLDGGTAAPVPPPPPMSPR